jgi:hypothetical protein
MTTQRKRRIMREFTIKELSAVDQPAQGHARAVLMKRDISQEEHRDMQFEKITREEPIAFDSLEAAMQHLKSVHGMSPLAAMSKAARDHPALVRRYNAEGERIAKQLARRVPTIPADVVRFDAAVDAIMARDGVDKLVAMGRARAEHPDLFAAYQAAGLTPSDLGLRPAGAVAT